jgi:actin-related protein
MSSIEKDQLRPIIIDIGSKNFRIGWAGDDFPDIIAPSVYVDKRDYIFTSDVIDGLEDIYITEKDTESHLFGHEALKYSNILKIHEFRKESNFNVFMKFFYYYYKQLGIPEEDQFKQPIVIISPFFMSDLEKTKLQDIFFNIFGFPSLLFLSESQGILATLRKTSGVVISMGEMNTTITTFLHGFSNVMARDTYPIAGKDLTNYLLNLILSRKGSGKTVYLDKMIANDIKKKLSQCVMDPEGEIRRIKDGLTKYNRNIDLPDGTSLEVNTERFMLTEPLFNPSLIHIDYIGLPEAVSKVIKFWDRENWEDILPNIILAGGGSLIPGLDLRLKTEISKHFSERLKDKINVMGVSGRENVGWIGASVLFAQAKLKKDWIQNPREIESQQEQESDIIDQN